MRQIRFMAGVLPALLVAVLTLVAVLPWGASQTMHFFLPFLPLIAIHYWTLRQPRLMPVWFVFVCGLAMDALSSGPLGFWSLIYLVGFALASLLRDSGVQQSALSRWLGVAVAMVGNGVMVWLLSSIYFTRLLDWQPLAISIAVAAAVYPLMVLLFWPVNRLWTTSRPGPLTRGM